MVIVDILLLFNIITPIGTLHISVDRLRYLKQLIPNFTGGTFTNDSQVYSVSILKIYSGKVVIKTGDILFDEIKDRVHYEL